MNRRPIVTRLFLTKSLSDQRVARVSAGVKVRRRFTNICDGNEDHYKYLLDWASDAIQNPGKPGEVAVVLCGKPGTGKGGFARHLGAVRATLQSDLSG